MEVIMKVGRYAGQKRELTYIAAKALIEAGDADPADLSILGPRIRSERIESVSPVSDAKIALPRRKR